MLRINMADCRKCDDFAVEGEQVAVRGMSFLLFSLIFSTRERHHNESELHTVSKHIHHLGLKTRANPTLQRISS